MKSSEDRCSREDWEIDRLAKGIEKSQHSARTRMTRALREDVTEMTPIGLRRRAKHRAKISTL